MRRLWRWIRAVIADRGESDPVPIFLEKADADGYSFRLGLRAGIDGQDVARIPVRKRINPDPHPILKEIHHCEVAGRVLEAANVYALREKVGALLDSIAPSRSLPLVYFRATAMDYVVPVYEDDGQIVSPVIGGPNLKSRDLGGIRAEVCRYLLAAGYVNSEEEVAVGILLPGDLSLVPPAAVIRSLDDSDLWIPTVEGMSADGPVIGVLGHAAQLRPPERRRTPGPVPHDSAPAAPDLVSLLRYVRAELERLHSNTDPAALYASEVLPEVWAAAERRTEEAGTRLVAPLESDGESSSLALDVRRTGAGDLVAALIDRHISVFLASDEDALARQVGSYLERGGFLGSPEQVETSTEEVLAT